MKLRKDETLLIAALGLIALLAIAFAFVIARDDEEVLHVKDNRLSIKDLERQSIHSIKSSHKLQNRASEQYPEDEEDSDAPASDKAFEHFKDRLNETNTGRLIETLELSPVEASIGISKRKLALGSDGALLHVELHMQKACFLGDYDLIRYDLKHNQRARLILSVESLVPNDAMFQPQIREVSLDNIQFGQTAVFKIPKLRAQEHLGLFFCLDSQNSGRCLDKKVYDINKLINAYFLVEPKVSRDPKRSKKKAASDQNIRVKAIQQLSSLSSDKIYYFAYLLLKEDLLLTFPGQIGFDAYKMLGDYLSSGGTERTIAIQVVNKVRQLTQTLKSVAINAEKPKLRIILPRFESSACIRKKEDSKLELTESE